MKTFFLSLIIFLLSQAIVPPTCNASKSSYDLLTEKEEELGYKQDREDDCFGSGESSEDEFYSSTEGEESEGEEDVSFFSEEQHFQKSRSQEFIKNFDDEEDDEKIYDQYLLAAQKGKIKVFNFLWNINEKEVTRVLTHQSRSTGNTILHIAARYGHVILVTFLMSFIKRFKIDHCIPNKHNQTPLDAAQEKLSLIKNTKNIDLIQNLAQVIEFLEQYEDDYDVIPVQKLHTLKRPTQKVRTRCISQNFFLRKSFGLGPVGKRVKKLTVKIPYFHPGNRPTEYDQRRRKKASIQESFSKFRRVSGHQSLDEQYKKFKEYKKINGKDFQKGSKTY